MLGEYGFVLRPMLEGAARLHGHQTVPHCAPLRYRTKFSPKGCISPTFLSSSVGSKQAHFGLIFSESHWGPYPKDTGL